ncbi:hypothetical protein PR048_030831 [Dryococelus australis]|uniref:Uncharacterized protein n=1 Tax=Dryococelus australis TaxID=614101 RepID=A0ABQ9GA05_9NEOP|nr:hypothetical protein PR048_030831 [Dryococelus australis]
MKEGYLVKELKFDEFKDLKDLGSKLTADRNKDFEAINLRVAIKNFVSMKKLPVAYAEKKGSSQTVPYWCDPKRTPSVAFVYEVH